MSGRFFAGRSGGSCDGTVESSIVRLSIPAAIDRETVDPFLKRGVPAFRWIRFALHHAATTGSIAVYRLDVRGDSHPFCGNDSDGRVSAQYNFGKRIHFRHGAAPYAADDYNPHVSDVPTLSYYRCRMEVDPQGDGNEGHWYWRCTDRADFGVSDSPYDHFKRSYRRRTVRVCSYERIGCACEKNEYLPYWFSIPGSPGASDMRYCNGSLDSVFVRGGVMVELKNVSFRYGSEGTERMNSNSLNGINLTVRKGEFLLLTGPSGCGKTTILRLINGLIPQFYHGKVTGEILIDGDKISSKELYESALLVGTVFQNPRTQFYNVDTTGELAFGCENQGVPEAEIYSRIDDTVAHFRMKGLMDRNIFHLSDGEKQKIACASVSISGTEIILLDEPSANLDYESTLMLRELIKKWKTDGKTIISAEHRIAYLWDLIDRAVILKDGQILCELMGDEKDAITNDQLKDLGLRSSVMENPSQIELPAIKDGDKILSIRDFHFSYKGAEKPVVDIIDLSVAEGEITAIIGGNGAGKTSLLNCICGLERRCRGTLVYKGKSYNRRERKKLVFMVMQDTGNQLFTESVLDEVLISLPKGTSDQKEQAIRILKDLDLDILMERHPQSLSGGQKQRLAIACAIASGREILLFDEPTSGLDYAHMEETARLMKDLQNRGTTILVVTHDSELIHSCCGRVIAL